jgi:DNA-binding XRE family transcriptional regulator
MARNFEELRAWMSPEARRRAEARAEAMLAEMPLAGLRQARGMTQEEMARALGTTQASVSRLERRADLHVSSLSRYVAAMGGELHVTARFPDGEVRLEGLADR